MAISVSVALLLLILAVIFIRNGGLKLSHATICVLLGFLLASTSAAPTIHHTLVSTADIINGVGK
ncbi:MULTISPECIES: hypothetical protein [Streptomyces]|uniref:Uncharacterized protein n=4 Tax=Streptomyces TaxID=1883 RepID=A0A8H9HPM6_9ACTN|nr:MULTISPECIES: hypothetical protein [Streptomyces]NEE24933.1 hypothetical protein [Streptomyces sp. SID7982]NEE54786.1 hypothetical protein [Streptomyces sp. SID8455]MBL3808094.1 hypothetical protein [Streptomyces sp. BRB081]NEC14341.1 hypothetical protein [Streptomyces sp. SID8014]PJM82858.1 hypothetical protein CH313_16465 [Streptomyces sp. TSRI0384-2]